MTMPFRVHNSKDLWAGIIYILFGAAAIVFSREFTMGTATKMGPAYFPTVLGGLLALIGVVSVVRSFWREGEPIGVFALRATLLVCGSVAIFAALVRGVGVVIALLILVVVSAYGSIKFRIGASVILAVGLAIFCALVFIKGLGIPLPLFGPWVTG